MSTDDAESLQAPHQRPKRPARVVVSDSEDEGGDVQQLQSQPQPNGGSRKRARLSPSEDYEDEMNLLDEIHSGDDYAARSAGPSRKSKGKGRLNGDDGSVDGEVMEDEEAAAVQFKPDYERDKNGFVAGSITRIKMRNFMTYDHVEFRPGPHLNMILGPNGTGKSTIAACIAIGLGFPPKVMGRANDLKSYVKQGSEEAETEIELKARKGKANVVIKRRFTRDDDKSEWFMNGLSTTKRTVLETVAEMGIQANNLCSFLPQDKVAEFAKMAPITVLKETMRAAGDPRLSKWHETLVEKGNKANDLEEVVEKDTAKRDNLQATVDRMEPDVQQFRSRAGQEFEREVLRILVHVAESKVVGQQWQVAQAERKELKHQEKVIQHRRRPLLELSEHHDHKKAKADVKVAEAEDRYKALPQQWNNAKRRYNDAEREGQQIDSDLITMKRKLQRREDEKERERRKIRDAQTILDTPREDIDGQIQAKNQQRKELVANGRAISIKLEDLKDKHTESERHIGELSKGVEDRARILSRLSTIEAKRESDARDLDGSINFALDWIEKNEMQLQGKVHKPPMISVSVQRKEYAWQVEACTSLSNRKTFICEERSDYDKLLELNGKQFPPRRSSNGQLLPGGQVRLNLALVDVTDETTNPRRPCSSEELAALGFDGFAIDFIEAEAGVKAYLVKHGLHAAALTRRNANDIDYNKLLSMGISNWVTATDINAAIRSSYGRREAQISSRGPIPARAFGTAVDQAAVKKIDDELNKLKLQMREREGPLQELKNDMNKANDKIRDNRQEQNNVEEEIKELRNQVSRYGKAQHDIEAATRRLENLEAEPSADESRTKLRAAKLKVTKKIIKPINDHTEACNEALDSCTSLIMCGLTALHCQLNVDAINDHLVSGDEEGEALAAQIQEMEKRKDELFQKNKAILATVRHMVQNSPTAVSTVVQDRTPDVGTPDDVAAQLAGIDADLELSAAVDQNFVQRYERLSKELNECKATVETDEKNLTSIKSQINKILSVFDPALNSLVDIVSSKFSAAFERVGCSGEVRINRVEGDFAQWGIHILVSYRDGDNLQMLTGSLQSGGERSLATVTYLMSLSEMARTPFSLVDEINQGMDQRAERNVHNQLVEVTCGTDAGQYFLITPKLLTGLRYHQNMKVLIINNGTWLPDSTDNTRRFGDLKSCLARYVAAH